MAARDIASVLFIVTEDWFFASHFLPMVRAARELGLDVTVVTRVKAHRQPIEACGADVIALDADRSSLNPSAWCARWRGSPQSSKKRNRPSFIASR